MGDGDDLSKGRSGNLVQTLRITLASLAGLKMITFQVNPGCLSLSGEHTGYTYVYAANPPPLA